MVLFCTQRCMWLVIFNFYLLNAPSQSFVDYLRLKNRCCQRPSVLIGTPTLCFSKFQNFQDFEFQVVRYKNDNFPRLRGRINPLNCVICWTHKCINLFEAFWCMLLNTSLAQNGSKMIECTRVVAIDNQNGDIPLNISQRPQISKHNMEGSRPCKMTTRPHSSFIGWEYSL